MTVNILTQKELKQNLSYDPLSGEFTRKSNGLVCGFNNGYGYIQIDIKNKKYRAHHLAFLYMDGALPPNHVDHINGIRDDNRWHNIRKATQQENNKNMMLSKRNKSGVPGVFLIKSRGVWICSIGVNGTSKHLGIYEDFFEAACARMSANNKYEFHPNHGRR